MPVKRKVMIFGAGVTGLSAAHELAQRGFQVLVVERDGDDRDPATPGLGGMARSQYNRANPTPFRKWSRGVIDPPTPMVDVQDLWVADDRTARIEKTLIEFKLSSLALTAASQLRLNALQTDLFEFLKSYRHTDNQSMKIPIIIWARSEPGEDLGAWATVGDKAYRQQHGRSFALARARATRLRSFFHWTEVWANIVRLTSPQPLPAVSVDFQILEPEADPLGDGPDSDYVGTRRGCGGILFDDLLLPGEHGYRLFPRFYRNLLDVMKRTPLLGETGSGARDRVVARGIRTEDPTSTKTTGAGTVFDMLRSIENHAFAPEADSAGNGGPPPRLMLRTKAKSWEDMVEAIRAQYEDLNWRTSDMAKYTVKVFQYMTSCKGRRAEYGEDSWWEYLDASTGSPGFQQSLLHWPKALVGLDSKTADARSFGSVSMQIMLDHTRPAGYRDGSLKGPTTEVWFDHWRTYLEEIGVTFVKGEIFSMKETGQYTDPNPVSFAATNVRSIEFQMKGVGADWDDACGPFAMQIGLTDRYVCNSFMVMALPLLESQLLCNDLFTHATPARKAALSSYPDPWEPPTNPTPRVLRSDIHRIANWQIPDPTIGGHLQWPGGTGLQSSLRHFPGVQYYFHYDYALVPGHTYFPDSRWGLSTITQTQFRARRPGAREGYVGLMSVVIGDPNNDGPNPEDKFFDLTREEIAREVLVDIRKGLEWGHMNLPEPVAYHVDSNMKFDASGQFVSNSSPYLTAKWGEWGGRPGRLDDPELWMRSVAAADNSTHPGYDVYFGRLVFAGNHMKTFTRLSTMESANESARHAVNGILSLFAKAGMTVSHDDLGSGQFVRVFDLEDDEVDDFLFLKQLDCELHKLGLDHLVNILQISEVATALLPGGGANDPIGNILSALTNTTKTSQSAVDLANLINTILSATPPP